jgi:hypothetical protein
VVVAVRAVKVALALNPVEVIFLSGLIRAKAEELAHFKSFLLSIWRYDSLPSAYCRSVIYSALKVILQSRGYKYSFSLSASPLRNIDKRIINIRHGFQYRISNPFCWFLRLPGSRRATRDRL